LFVDDSRTSSLRTHSQPEKPFGVLAKNTKDGFVIKTVCKTHYSPSLKA
jgi:hypothetical protein